MRAWRKLREAAPAGWLGDYLRGRLQAEPVPPGKTIHLLFMFADHWEPRGGVGPPPVRPDQPTRDWAALYPRAASAHFDADGRHPQHTFFYPYEEYYREDLEVAAALSAAGFGEVELHLHHRDDTSVSLARKLEDAVGLFLAAGCLGRRADGSPAFGFVHGDWALDNSRHEGGRNFCGVNDELRVLASAGCFADYTFPAFGCEAQPRWVNRILRVLDDPRPRSYDRGVEARVGPLPPSDLVLFSGPLTFYWFSPAAPASGRSVRRASGGQLRLRLDDGQITGINVPHPDRTDAWVRAHIHVRGRPEWVFVKVHTHGCTGRNRLPLLRKELDRLWTDLEQRYNDGERYRLHYVTAREAYNVLRAAEDGLSGDPGRYRDYEIAPPACRDRAASGPAGRTVHEMQGSTP